MSKNVFQDMADKWPSAVVARSEIRKFTGGLYSPGRMANLDCAGQGPRRKMQVGRKTAYPVDALIEWLEERVQPSTATRPAA